MNKYMPTNITSWMKEQIPCKMKIKKFTQEEISRLINPTALNKLSLFKL